MTFSGGPDAGSLPAESHLYALVFSRCDANAQCTRRFGDGGNGTADKVLAALVAATWRLVGRAWLLENIVGLRMVAVVDALVVWPWRRGAGSGVPTWLKGIALSPVIVAPVLAGALTVVRGWCLTHEYSRAESLLAVGDASGTCRLVAPSASGVALPGEALLGLNPSTTPGQLHSRSDARCRKPLTRRVRGPMLRHRPAPARPGLPVRSDIVR